MKRMAILATIVVGGLAASVVAQRMTLPGITDIAKVTDNLYKIGGAGGNTTVFIRADGVVLVDTKLPDNGAAILAQVRKVTDKPVTMIVNTHSHPDHLGSNDYFKKGRRSNVQIVAHENTAKNVAGNPQANAAMKPDQTFSDRLTLGSGDDRIELYYFGAGHTGGDAFVVFPSERAMTVGDIMAWKMSPLIDPASGGSVLALPVTLTKAVDTIKGVDIVIEGHGDVNTWEGFRSYTTFNRALVSTAMQTLERNGTPEQVVAALGRNPSMYIFLSDELLPGLEYGGTPRSRALINVNVAFQELKGEPVTTNWGPPPPADDN